MGDSLSPNGTSCFPSARLQFFLQTLSRSPLPPPSWPLDKVLKCLQADFPPYMDYIWPTEHPINSSGSTVTSLMQQHLPCAAPCQLVPPPLFLPSNYGLSTKHGVARNMFPSSRKAFFACGRRQTACRPSAHVPAETEPIRQGELLSEGRSPAGPYSCHLVSWVSADNLRCLQGACSFVPELTVTSTQHHQRASILA